MHCDLHLWPFDLKIYRAHPWLMGSLHVKFHDDGCKKKVVMCRKPFSVIYALWPWPLTFWPQNLKGTSLPHGESAREVSWWSVKRESIYAPETIFSNLCIVTLTFDLLTSKSIGHILDSWGVCMWSFMMIGVKGKQLCTGNPNAEDRRTDRRTWWFQYTPPPPLTSLWGYNESLAVVYL